MIDRCATIVKLINACVCSALLIACTPTVMQNICPDDTQQIEDPMLTKDGRSLSLLNYYEEMSHSTEQGLKTEHRLLLSRQATEPGSRDQLRLAVVLSRTDTPLRDDQHAQLLIEDYLESGIEGHDEDKAFAKLMLDILAERKRHRRSESKIKAALNSERELRDGLKKKSDQLEVEIVQLKAKLDQLKAIEEDITESEQSIVAPLPENQPNGNETKSSSGRR